MLEGNIWYIEIKGKRPINKFAYDNATEERPAEAGVY